MAEMYKPIPNCSKKSIKSKFKIILPKKFKIDPFECECVKKISIDFFENNIHNKIPVCGWNPVTLYLEEHTKNPLLTNIFKLFQKGEFKFKMLEINAENNIIGEWKLQNCTTKSIEFISRTCVGNMDIISTSITIQPKRVRFK